jgi:hypothetical protein
MKQVTLNCKRCLPALVAIVITPDLAQDFIKNNTRRITLNTAKLKADYLCLRIQVA